CSQFLLVEPAARELAALAAEDELVGTVPVLDDVQPLVDVATQRLGREIPAQKDGLDGLPKLGQRLVRRVLGSRAGEAGWDRFGVSSPQSECGGVLDQLVALLLNEMPIDRSREDRRQSWVGLRLASLRAVEFLNADRLHALESSKPRVWSVQGRLRSGQGYQR